MAEKTKTIKEPNEIPKERVKSSFEEKYKSVRTLPLNGNNWPKNVQRADTSKKDSE